MHMVQLTTRPLLPPLRRRHRAGVEGAGRTAGGFRDFTPREITSENSAFVHSTDEIKRGRNLLNTNPREQHGDTQRRETSNFFI